MYKILVFLLFCLFLVNACGNNKIILPDGNSLEVELATTKKQIERGLMFREELPQGTGMLFIFKKDEPRLFWMKNTLIDLDMVFIDSGGFITGIEENIPHSYLGATDEEITRVQGWGKYVLEINASAANKYNLKKGDRLILKIK